MTRKQRIDHQLAEWVKGNSVHNDEDDECCPDFSCCKPELLQPEEVRKTFFAVCKAADEEGYNEEHHPFYDLKMEMLMSFLGAAMNQAAEGKKIYVSTETKQITELN